MTNKEQTIKNLKELMEIDSKTSNVEGVNQMGLKVIELLNGLDLEWSPIKKEGAADHLIARTKSFDKTKPTILLSAHMDVVISSSEIEVKEDETKVYGSGAQDVKGAIIALVEVLKKLKENKNLTNIILSLSSEEELALPNFRDDLIPLAKEADFILVFEPTLNYEPEAALNKRSVVLSRRGFKQWDLTIEGPGGHSGILYQKEKRKSAILLMAEIILELEKLADYDKVTTINSGMLDAGKAFNILAPNAHLVFETRFNTNEEFERISSDIEKLIKEKSKDETFKLTLVGKNYVPAMHPNGKNKKFLEICEKVARDQNIEFITEHRTGGSEAGFFQYFNPNAALLDGFGIRGDGEHSLNEYVLKESIFTTIEYVYSVILEVLSSYSVTQ